MLLLLFQTSTQSAKKSAGLISLTAKSAPKPVSAARKGVLVRKKIDQGTLTSTVAGPLVPTPAPVTVVPTAPAAGLAQLCSYGSSSSSSSGDGESD